MIEATQERRFSEGPPSLADTVCLATLEANQARPGRYLSVSSQAWPQVHIEQRWAEVLTAWLIFRQHAEVPIDSVQADPVEMIGGLTG